MTCFSAVLCVFAPLRWNWGVRVGAKKIPGVTAQGICDPMPYGATDSQKIPFTSSN